MKKGLSTRQPWAWALLHGKLVENRHAQFSTSYLGPLLIHASQTFDDEGYFWIVRNEYRLGLTAPLPSKSEFLKGGFIGKGVITGYVKEYDSPWFFGPIGVLINDSEQIPFVPYPGQLGLFNVNIPKRILNV